MYLCACLSCDTAIELYFKIVFYAKEKNGMYLMCLTVISTSYINKKSDRFSSLNMMMYCKTIFNFCTTIGYHENHKKNTIVIKRKRELRKNGTRKQYSIFGGL